MSYGQAENDALLGHINKLQLQMDQMMEDAATMRILLAGARAQLANRDDYVTELEKALEHTRQGAMGWAWDVGMNLTPITYCVWCQKKLGSDMAVIRAHVTACRETHVVPEPVASPPAVCEGCRSSHFHHTCGKGQS